MNSKYVAAASLSYQGKSWVSLAYKRVIVKIKGVTVNNELSDGNRRGFCQDIIAANGSFLT